MKASAAKASAAARDKQNESDEPAGCCLSSNRQFALQPFSGGTKMQFTIHNLETAPAASRPLLEQTRKAFGFIPNLMGVFAESPAATQAYLVLGQALKHSTLTAVQQEVVFIAVSAESNCSYCVAAHSAHAAMVKMPPAILGALRDQATLPDSRLEALRQFALALVRKRGWLDQSDFEAFFAARYTQAQALDVITILAMKTLSNYANHVAETPLDSAFENLAWNKTGN